MTFSIIVVCLNAGERLRETMESIERQTAQNYEVIIKDGGSTDEATKAYLEKYKEAQLIISPEDEIRDRLVIIPLILAKGLEFDVVILLGCIQANEGTPHFRRRIYLGCTRALHELYFVEREALPDSLAEFAAYMEITEFGGEV